ncbi:DNA helicase [Tanacetum coccineum]
MKYECLLKTPYRGRIRAPTGVSILPFGGVSAFEEMFNLLHVPSANCPSQNTQLYLDVFQKCSEFCSLSSADVMRMDFESQKLKSTDAADIFQAYFALCSRGIGRCRSVNVRQTTNVSSSNFIHNNDVHNTGLSTPRGGRNTRANPKVSLTTGEATCSRGICGLPLVNVCQTTTVSISNFIHNNDVRNTIPSTPRGGRYTRANPQVSLKTGEATFSRGIRGRPLVNVCQTTIVSISNFIHNNDVRSTGPSILRVGRNTRTNPKVSLTTAEATCSSGISRHHSVRRRPTTRDAAVGSSFVAGAVFVKCVVTCFLQGPHTFTLILETLIRGGNIYMQPPREPPKYIKSLFGNKHFMENVRAYNQMFEMTSFGAKINESTNAGRGPYVFKVSGQVYHWIGSLCPPSREAPRFLQLYIYDTDNEVENRMRHFGGIHNSDLDPRMVEGLIHFLDAYNELVQLFRTTRDKCRELHIPEFKIRLYNGQGFHTDLKLRSADGRDRAKRVTMLIYYRYQLHFILQQYDLIFRKNKNSPCLHERADATCTHHYLDALAIFQKLGNPQFFITFTYNVNWPEIKRFMAQYPELTASDRADVVCPVFEQKIQSFVTFLKEELLYTFEFQKRGLPHCHTLLWVDSNYVVPYNRDLLLAFRAHINIEYCGWSMLIKYLFKYISKSTDRIFAWVSRPMGESSTEAAPSREVVDEIQNYVEGRFICAHEAY